MTPENFIYWLQGYLELSNVSELSKEQIQIIRDHIKLVFDKKTPTRSTILSNPSTFTTMQCLIPNLIPNDIAVSG